MRYAFLSMLVIAPALALATETKIESTHRQASVLKPTREGTEIALSAFTLDAEGNIVAAVQAESDAPRRGKRGTSQGWLQVYSPDKKLLREIALPFAPTALAITTDGHYLAGGNGKLCKTTADGKIVEQGDLMVMLGMDPKKLKEEAILEYRKNHEEFGHMFQDQRAIIQAQIERMEKKAAGDRTDRDKLRLDALKAQLASLPAEENPKEPPAEELEATIRNRMYIPSMAATPTGTIVTIVRNRAYEVWQTSPKFDQAKQVLTGLKGCCGQMDVTTAGERILTAENTKFQVGIYDLTGKKVSTFGERFKEGNNGFGSCCNPMNVVGCANGDILTAESSIGHIKRFNSEGKLLGIIGRARIGGGCKHVSLGFDAKRDRYYVQYQDMNHICVMLPNAEAAPLVAEQDKLQKEAEAAAQKLVGKWKAGEKKAKKRSSNDFEVYSSREISGFDFRADHSMIVAGTGPLQEGDNGFRRWLATGMEKGAITMEVEEADGYVEFVANIEIKDDNTIRLTKDGQTTVYTRQPAKSAKSK